MKYAIIALLALNIQTATAQTLGDGETIVTPDAFDAYSLGTTITYHRYGAPYGAEQHFKDRRVKWLRGDGTCSDGSWRADGTTICFTYDDAPSDEHCLNVIDTPKGRVHRFLDQPASEDLIMVGQSKAPLICDAPPLAVSFQPYQGLSQ